MRRVALAAFAVLLTMPAWAQDDLAARCDALAASPLDPQTAAGTGILFDDINADAAIEACTIAVASGSTPRLIYQLGRAYDAQKDFAEAKVHYEAASALGYALATVNLGLLYSSGDGVPADPVKAQRLFEAAYADEKLPSAAYNLGYSYQFGEGVDIDYDRARQLYEEAEAAGNTDAAFQLGDLYQYGIGVPKDYAKALPLYEKAYAVGKREAAYQLGTMQHYGRGMPANYEKAIALYNEAAGKGYTDALNSLAKLYEDGHGPKGTGRSEAEANYRKARELGSGWASIWLYNFFRDDDLSKARPFAEEVLDNSDPEVAASAHNALAWSYATQEGDLAKAEPLALRALELDDQSVAAQDTLGYIRHLQGRNAEALPYLQRAIELGPDDHFLYATYAHLGDAQAALGDTDAAKASYTEALRLLPTKIDDDTVDPAAIQAWLDAH